MWPYWLMFLIPAVPAIVASSSGTVGGSSKTPPTATLAWLLVGLMMTLMIGFRFEVGGDWQEYFEYLVGVTGLSLAEVLMKPDPAYQVLNWISTEFGWGIYGVNLMGGAIFCWGLIAFCRRQPQPWLGLALAVPYLVIVVAMGYSRQGIALGLALAGLVSLSDRSNVRFVLWIILAAAFHKSAILLLPLAALASTRNRYWTVAWVMICAGTLFYLLLASDVENLYAGYIETDYQSQGALIRLLMNALPSAIFLIWRRRFQFSENENRLWTWMALFSLALTGTLLSTSASTAVDRVALYMLPLQIAIFARLPTAFGKISEPNPSANYVRGASGTRSVSFLTAAVLTYYGLVQYVWLNYAQTAFAWVPYRFYPLESGY